MLKNEPYPPDPPEDPMMAGLRQMAGQVTHIALLDKDGNILVTSPVQAAPMANGDTITFSDITLRMS